MFFLDLWYSSILHLPLLLIPENRSWSIDNEDVSPAVYAFAQQLLRRPPQNRIRPMNGGEPIIILWIVETWCTISQYTCIYLFIRNIVARRIMCKSLYYRSNKNERDGFILWYRLRILEFCARGHTLLSGCCWDVGFVCLVTVGKAKLGFMQSHVLSLRLPDDYGLRIGHAFF